MALSAEQQALDFNPELQDVSRQRKLAELLMAQGMQQPQGQMISGQYVAPSWAQQLNPMANILAGQAVGERADTEQLKIAKALKQQQIAEAQNIMSAENQEDRIAAALRGNTPLSKTLVPKLLESYTKEPNWERTEINANGNIIKGVYDKRNPNVMATFRPYNESIDVPLAGARYSGVVPQNMSQGSPNSINQPQNAYQPNQPRNANDLQLKPGVLNKMPETAAFVTNKYDLETPKQFNTPKERDEWFADSRKPLTGEPLKMVTGAENTIVALRDFNKGLQNFTRADLVNPDKSANMTGLAKNAYLALKDAKGLGVLNKEDLPQLEAIMRNPSDWKNILNSKELFQKLADRQIEFASNVIATNYKNSYKQIPDATKQKLIQIDSEVVERQKADVQKSLDKPLMYQSPDAVETAGKAGKIKDGQLIIIGNQKFRYKKD